MNQSDMWKKCIFATLMMTSASALTFTACKKDESPALPNNPNSGNAQVTMKLTDGPAAYDAVYLDIQSVEVITDNNPPVVMPLVRPGIYDILQFRNGLDTLLGVATVPAGKISQIRLILGNNNSVVENGQAYPLTTPSGQTSGVKLNLNETFVAGGAYTVWIDFDAAKSIHVTGNGKYMLKPVIRAYSTLTDGRIKGYVLPPAALATVYAINGVDTFAAIPSAVDGYFQLNGLPQATYTLWFDATVAPFVDQTLTNVQVTYGTETNVGTINL